MSFMLSNSTLFLTIIAVGGLVYLGTVAFDPTHPTPRVISGYVCGSALTLIGAISLAVVIQFYLPLLLQGVSLFEVLHMEWLGLGLMAFIVGIVIVRQAYRRR